MATTASNGNFTPVGTPPVKYLGSQQQANEATKVDWEGVVIGNRIQADYTFATAGAATAAWTNSAWYPPAFGSPPT